MASVISQDRVDVLKTEGNALFKEEKYSEAVSKYTEALSFDNCNATLYSNRSASHSKLGNYEDALHDACQCIHHSRGWSKGYLRKIIALEGLKDFPNVMATAEEAFKCASGNDLRKEFVKRWFDANQLINQLPEGSIELPCGIHILSQKYLNVLIHLMRSLSGEHPLNNETAKQCLVACAEQIEEVLTCFGEPVRPLIKEWGINLIVDIYPDVVEVTQREKFNKELINRTESLILFLEKEVHSSLYLVLRPILGLAVLVILNRTNILTESNSGHHVAELMNRALIPLFESSLLNTDAFCHFHIGRLCAILDSYIGRLYRLTPLEIETIKLYCGKLEKAIAKYPKDFPDYIKNKVLVEQTLHNINCNVLQPSTTSLPASGLDHPLTVENASNFIQQDPEKVRTFLTKRFSVLKSIEFLTLGEVEELITMTNLFIDLGDKESATDALIRGEREFFQVLGRNVESNALKLNDCSTTIATFRQMVLLYAKKLCNLLLFADISLRWKCLFTEIRSLFIQYGLGNSLASSFLLYINELTTSKHDSKEILQKSLLEVMEKEDAVLASVAKNVFSTIKGRQYKSIQECLHGNTLIIDYVCFVPLTSECIKECCVITRKGNNPVILDLSFDKIRKQVAVVIDVMTKTRGLFWSQKDSALGDSRLNQELIVLSDLLLPDVLKSMLTNEITQIYVCPDGDIGCIPFGMLPLAEEGKRLDEVASVVILTSVQDLFSKNQPEYLQLSMPSTSNDQFCYIIANPNFDSQLCKPGLSIFDKVADLITSYLVISESPKPIVNQLEHSKSEADFVSYRLLTCGLKVKTLLQDDANLCTVLAIESPLMIHFSTHGYGQNQRLPLIRGDFFTNMSCGIALAGFNTYSRQLYKQINPECSIGQLPSLAISSMNLHGTKLVYLSMCNSAAGLLATQEAAVTLVQAFITAGVETVIGTLWPVKDESAAEFSKYFYDHLLNPGIRPSQALVYAKNKFLLDPLWRHWTHWGSFVCYGLDKPLI